MRMTPVVVFVSFLLLLLTWLLLSGMNLNSTRFESELRALDEFSRFERGLNREVSCREVQDEKCLAAQFSCLFWNVQRTSCRIGR